MIVWRSAGAGKEDELQSPRSAARCRFSARVCLRSCEKGLSMKRPNQGLFERQRHKHQPRTMCTSHDKGPTKGLQFCPPPIFEPSNAAVNLNSPTQYHVGVSQYQGPKNEPKDIMIRILAPFPDSQNGAPDSGPGARSGVASHSRYPNVALLRALWSLQHGIWGLLKGSWGCWHTGLLSQYSRPDSGDPKKGEEAKPSGCASRSFHS